MKIAAGAIALVLCLLQFEVLVASFRANLLAMALYQASYQFPDRWKAFSSIGASTNLNGRELTDFDCTDTKLKYLSLETHPRIIGWRQYFCGDIDGAIRSLAQASLDANPLAASEHAHLLWNYFGPEQAGSSPGAAALAYSLVETASLQFQSGDEEKARQLFEKALELNDVVPYAHYGLGSILAGREETLQESLRHLYGEIEINPGFQYSYRKLAGVLLNLKKLEEAEKFCLEAISRDPRLPVYDVLLRIYQRRSDCSRAIWAAERLIRYEGGDEVRLIYTLVACGKRERAVRELEQVLKSNPNHSEAKKLLSDLQTPTSSDGG